jgi:MFS family permease
LKSDYNPLLRRKIFYGWWVLLVTIMASVFVGGAGSWTFSILITPMTEAFGWSHAQLLFTLTVAGFLSAFLSPVAGMIVDRYGSRVLVVSCVLFLGTMLILTSRIQALWQFYILYSLGTGVSQTGVSRVGAVAVAANWFIRRRGIAFAMSMGATTLTGVIFSLLAQGLVDRWDWRMVWLVLGLAVLVVPVPLAWLVIRRRPEDMGLRPDGDDAQVPTQPAATQPEGGITSRRRARLRTVSDVSWTLKEASKTRAFWLINMGLFLIGFPSASIIIVMHPYFTESGASPATAARLLSFYAFSSFLGALVWGALIQLFSVRTLLMPSGIAYASAIALFTLLGRFHSIPLLYLSILPLGITIMGSAQIGNQVWPDYYGRQWVGSIIGVSGLMRTVPMAMGPVMAAAIHDSMGSYSPAFVLFAVFCFIAGVGFIFARPPQKAERQVSP